MDISARYIPAGSTAVLNKSGSAVAYLYNRGSRPCAIGFRGRAIKPRMHYCYSSEDRRAESVAEFLRQADEIARRKEQQKSERAAKLAQPHGLALGDVLVCSWGYEQTNVDYYQVTKLIGNRTVEIRPIAQHSEETLSMQGNAFPRQVATSANQCENVSACTTQ